MSAQLEVKTIAEGDTIKVIAEGRIDAVTATIFDKEISSAVDQTNTLIVDFDKVNYLSSAGIRVLVGASRALKNKGEVQVINVSKDIMEIFAMVGLLNKMNISGK